MKKRKIIFANLSLTVITLLPIAAFTTSCSKNSKPKIDVNVESIEISGDTEVTVGNTTRLTAKVFPENASDKSLTWWATNEYKKKVIDIDQKTGVISALEIGKAYVTATANDGSDVVSQQWEINVVSFAHVTKVQIQSITSILEKNKTQLKAKVEPETATVKDLAWSSNNPDVIAVETNTGIISAIKPGQATIRASATDGSEQYDECTITVLQETESCGYVVFDTGNEYFSSLTDTGLCASDNRDIVINMKSFKRSEFNYPIVLNENISQKIPDNFLYKCTTFNSNITFPNNLLWIGSNFLGSCTSFSKPLTLPDTVTNIGENFMSSCSAFNHRSDQDDFPLPRDLTVIGSGFMRNCRKFAKGISMGNQINEIGSDFLYGCEKFDGSIQIPQKVQVIQDGFLSGCKSFDRQINFGLNIKKIGDNFLQGCISFKQPIVLSQNIESIGSGFLFNCKNFNRTISISPDETVVYKLTSIGDYFLSGCEKFEETITLPNSLLTIGSNFMSHCIEYNNELKIPDSVTSIGDYFMSGCVEFNCGNETNISSAFNLPTQLSEIGSYFLENCKKFSSSIVIPNNVRIIQHGFLKNCVAFNSSLTLPYTITEIGNEFLFNCKLFNAGLSLPSQLTKIGDSFLEGCEKFDSQLHLPSGLNYVGTRFVYNCKKLTKVYWEAHASAKPEDVFVESEFSFATDDVTAAIFNELKLYFQDDLINFHKKFPNKYDSPPYRRALRGN